MSPVEKTLKKVHMRVSDDAVKELTQLLEEITADIASEAAAEANRAKRKVGYTKFMVRIASR